MIRVYEPDLSGNEKKYLGECIDSGWISSEGPFVRRFETGMAARTGRKHAIAVTNGSSALEASVAALGLGPNDEVILPSFSIISCAAAVVRAGAVPVLVDADPLTWNVDVDALPHHVSRRTRAIIVTHTYGLAADIDVIIQIAEKYRLHVVEDAAEAHGLKYKGRECGGFGDVSTFSFYANKHVACGEGGMILTDDDRLAEHCRSLRNLCFQAERRFVHRELGWNLRMSNLQAAVGLAQLERLDKFTRRKRELGRRYTELLADVPGLQLPLSGAVGCENIYWVFGLVLRDEVDFDAAEAMRRLGVRGIETRPFFYPMHLQPVFRRQGYFEGVNCPAAERLALRGFYIPSGIGITESQIATVAGAVREIMR
jgi:perosamine synthetase